MNKAVADRLQSVRKSKGIKGEDIADQLGIRVSTYSNNETGKSKISIERLYKIANILDVSIYELLPNNKTSSNQVEEPFLQYEKWNEFMESYKLLQKRVAEIESKKGHTDSI